jgi:hypothetical protein
VEQLVLFLVWLLSAEGEKAMIEAVIERFAGIDVGKKFLIVCVMAGPLDAEPHTEIRKFATIRRRAGASALLAHP